MATRSQKFKELFARDQLAESSKYTWRALKFTLIVLEKILDGSPVSGLKDACRGVLLLAQLEEVITIKVWVLALKLISTIPQDGSSKRR
jgi:hypothetical protein